MRGPWEPRTVARLGEETAGASTALTRTAQVMLLCVMSHLEPDLLLILCTTVMESPKPQFPH